ncbi:MAG: 5-(carboxyamino)imidazole ribonucleotide mutase [Phycisphaeraceae bacterium]
MSKTRPSKSSASPLVGIIMGSASDWETMQPAHAVLDDFGVAHECKVLSAHRTPDEAAQYARTAEERGLEVIIAGAGGAAHLAGVLAAFTTLPMLGVPVQTKSLGGLDSLLSMVQMPGGIPVATLAIGPAGAKNAGLMAVAILANARPELRKALHDFRRKQAESVRNATLPV